MALHRSVARRLAASIPLVLVVAILRSRSCSAFGVLATGRNGVQRGAVSLSEHTLNVEGIRDGDDFLEEDGPKARLLAAIGALAETACPPRFGFGDDSAAKEEIEQLVGDVSGYVLPLEHPSEWRLLYTGAPDLLGLEGGPLSRLVSIRQAIPDREKLEIELEYEPSEGILGLAGSFLDGLGDDRLVQTVRFGYGVGPMNKVDLELSGTSLSSTRLSSLLGQGGSNLPPLSLPSPLPFSGFSVVFNDGDLRVDRTVQGDFLLIYRREK